MRPLNTLHEAVKSVLGDHVQSISRNTRIYVSTYHKPGLDLGALPNKGTERGQIILKIFGDERPYSLISLYRIETLSGGKWTFSRYDKDLAKRYLEKVEEFLAARPVDRDLIDDFRPY